MKINENYILREIANERILVPVGGSLSDSSELIVLNQTAYEIYQGLKAGMEKKKIVEKIMNEYDADRTAVEDDFDSLVSSMRERGVLID